MNLRNRLNGEKEDAGNKITFSLDGEKWADVSYSCDVVSLATFLLNLVDIGNKLLIDEWIPENVVEVIHEKWREDVKNLSTK